MTEIMTIFAVINDKARPPLMARSYLPGAGSGFAADRRTAFRPRDRLHLVLSMCGPF